MSAANALFSVAFQLAMGLGVGLGAIALRLGERLADLSGAGAVAPFRVAFLIVALVSLLGRLDSLRLTAHAGENMAKATRS